MLLIPGYFSWKLHEFLLLYSFVSLRGKVLALSVVEYIY